jgi:formate dehydrogenase
MEVVTEDNRVVKINGDKNHPLSKGYLCIKGKAMAEYQSDELRVTSPYQKVNGEWKQIGWKEAYRKITARLKHIIEKHGPRSTAMYFGGGIPLSSAAPGAAASFLKGMGSDRFYNVLTLEFTNRYLAFQKMYGKQFRVSQADIPKTDCLLIFGHNPLVSLDHPGIKEEIRGLSKRGAKMIVVDPRLTETAKVADTHIQIEPGKDLFLLEGMIHHIMAKKMYDAEFLEKHTVNSEFFHQHAFLTPEEAGKLCGVPAESIIQIAEDFAKAKTASAICKLGVNVSPNSTVTYWLVEVLNSLTGNVDREGSLIFNPGIIDLDQKLALALGEELPTSYFGKHPYLTGAFPASELSREILMDNKDKVRALFVSGGDPSIVFPNSTRTQDAMRDLVLLVSVDYYMNETAQEADFFLPTTHFLEQEDLFTMFPEHQPYPFGFYAPKIVEPPENVKTQWDIYAELCEAMGIPFLVGDLIKMFAPSPDEAGPTVENYFKLLMAILGKANFDELKSAPHGFKVDDIRFGEFLEKVGKIDVAPQEFVDALKAVNVPITATEEYPLTLISNERIIQTKTTSLRGVPMLTSKVPENYARIHPEDAYVLDIADGENIQLETKNGSVVVRAKIDHNIRKGVVSILPGLGMVLFHPEKGKKIMAGANANLLTDDENLDPLSGMPVYNAIPCRIRRQGLDIGQE